MVLFKVQYFNKKLGDIQGNLKYGTKVVNINCPIRSPDIVTRQMFKSIILAFFK
jgi:hypothetical protein